ncbi:unnamed protein product [Urochloa humidicola]
MARANQRSCRRCHRELPVCPCGGGARRSARLRRDPDAGDRISALHDDLLLQILRRVGCAHSAARTSVLSRRWRGLWTRIPELVLREIKPHSLHFDAMLAQLVAVFRPQARARPQALVAGGIPEPQPPLSILDIRAPSHRRFSSAQISSLFIAAGRLQPASLVVGVAARAPGVAAAVALPRLNGTKSITLEMHGVKLLPPLLGIGPKIESLSLRDYDAFLDVPFPRYFNLRSLSISNWHHGSSIMIVQPSLEELFLIASVKLQHVVIMASKLKRLTFHAKAGVVDNLLVYLPKELEELSWQCTDHVSPARFGDIWSLRIVTIKTSEPLEQLQQSPHSNTLSLDIMEWELFVQEGATSSFEHRISSISPVANFSGLELCINSCGHVYGAMVLHLLEVYTLIERLKVDLRKFRARGLCSANCPCIQLNDWRSQTVSLTHLKEMEIKGIRGEDHDIDILKVILRSAAMLERVAVTFKTKSKQRIHCFSSKIHSILNAHPSVRCEMYRCSGEQVLSA